MSLLSIAGDEDATYRKGGFHVFHKGVVYLNVDRDTMKPIIFPDNAIGKLLDSGEIEVGGHLKQKHTLSKADTIMINMEDGSKASYLEGGFELNWNGETYLLADDEPLFSKESSTFFGRIQGNTFMRVGYALGRRIISYEFEKQCETTLKKRKQLDMQTEERFTQAKKKASILEKNASTVLEITKQALSSIEELINLDETMCSEADVEEGNSILGCMLTLEKAKAELSDMISMLKGVNP